MAKDNENEKQPEKNADPKGRGWHGDSEGHAEAGKKGGEQSPSRFEEGSRRAREAGRKGGES